MYLPEPPKPPPRPPPLNDWDPAAAFDANFN